MRVEVEATHVDRVDVGAAVAGAPAAVTLDAVAHLDSLKQGDADATIRQIGGAGTYKLSGRIDDAHITAHVDASEPAHGLVSGLAGLPDLGALAVRASVDGPWTAAVTDVAISAGPLRATAKGSVNVTGQAADLDVGASAPAMAPRPDLTWQSIALDAHVHGPFTKPEATANLRVDSLAAAGAALHQLTAQVSGNAGAVALRASVDGLRIPGPKPDLLEAAPLALTANARLDTPDRPVTFTLTHPLVTANGTANTGGVMAGQVALTLPDLAPFAAIGGVDLHGRTDLTIKAALHGNTTQADIDGTVGVTGGLAPIPGLVGPAAKLGVSAAMTGSDITLSRLQVDGSTLHLAANGGMTGGVVTLDWKLALADLAVLAPTIAGTLDGQGHVAGKTDDLAATADLSGEVATKGYPRAPVKVSLKAQGLPGTPSGDVTAQGTLEGAPLTLAANAKRAPDGTLNVTIEHADWKSANATGALALAPGAKLPTGKVVLRVTRLADFRALAGQPLDGSVDATAELDRRRRKC